MSHDPIYRRVGEFTTREFAAVLAKAMPAEDVARLLNVLVGIDGDPRFTDREAELGQRLFDRLRSACPAAEAICLEEDVQ